MSSSPPPATWRRIVSILWFPLFFAIALPVTFEAVYHQPQPHNVPIAVVGTARQVSLTTGELHHVDPGGFDVRPLPSAAAAAAAVRGRRAAAAYVDRGPVATVYLARAAAPIRASYLQGVFTRIAGRTGHQPPAVIDLVPLAAGDGGTGVFFFVFPLMMTGAITAIVLLQLPTWPIGRRAAAVATAGAVGTLATYLTAVSLDILPAKPLLLGYAFLLTQVFGQLMTSAAPLLKQYFLPAALTFALILSVPASGGTVTPDLLPTPFRYLSDALPLAQAVSITRSVAYFHTADITQPTLVLLAWAAIAAGTTALARRQQSRPQRPPGDRYAAGSSARLARRRATATPQGMPSRRTSARPSTSGAGRAAPRPRHATATAAQVRASGRYKPRSRSQARRVAATSIVAPSTTAAPAHSTHAVTAGVRPS
jgi:hypothetical protein